MTYIILYKDGNFNKISENIHNDLPSVWEDLKKTEEYDLIENIFQEGQPQYDEILAKNPLYEPSKEEVEVEECKANLQRTDYTVIKNAEKLLKILADKFDDIELSYLDVIEQRQIWRDRINEIEESYKKEAIT